jgi:hypothetical protein
MPEEPDARSCATAADQGGRGHRSHGDGELRKTWLFRSHERAELVGAIVDTRGSVLGMSKHLEARRRFRLSTGIIPTHHFSKDDTRETALRKAGSWYDRIVDTRMTTFATAIGKGDVPFDEMLAGIHQAQLSAVQGRAPFLADVTRVLDEVIAMGSGD